VTADALRAAAGLPAGVLVALALAVGLCVGAVLTASGFRGDGSGRRAWTWLAVACVLWAAADAALALGLPAGLYWNVARPLGQAGFLIGVAAFPGTPRRPPRDLAGVALDGWLTVGGVFLVAWMYLHLPSLGPVSHATGGYHWVAVDLVTQSVFAGMLARAAPEHRRAMGLVLAVGLAGMVGDVVLAVTGHVALTLLLHAVSVAGLALLPRLTPDGDLFAWPASPPPTPTSALAYRDNTRVIRLWQLPFVPAAYFMLSPTRPDAVATACGLSLAMLVFVMVARHSRENAALLATVRDQSRRFSELLRDSRDAIVQLDAAGRVEYANPALELVLGYRGGELTGRTFSDLVHPVDLVRVRADLGSPAKVDGVHPGTAAEAPVPAIEARIRHRDGRMVATESSVTRRAEGGGWVLTTRDVTERVRLRDELAAQARTDPLTGLLNRAAFLALTDERLRGDRPAIVLFVDLDQFKVVNDTFGHAAGDELLGVVATRLRTAVGPGDVVARLGGDEFAVLTRTSDLQRALATAGAVVEAVGRLEAPGGRHRTVSVGLATGAGVPAAQLLREADLAMYRAKGRGGGCAVVFEPWMSERVLERSHLRHRLEGAIGAGGLLLELQPVVHLGTGGWSGFEALVRWQDGDRRRGPGEFLPLAEESGLVVPMGTWVLREALAQLAGWPDARAGVAVNVSPQQLEETGFARLVTSALDAAGVAPDRLTLEITEQTAVDDLGRTASRLSPLRELGVHVAVDDFGTGYSSMRYLTRLPVDSLKIDRQFVDGLGVRPRDEVLVVSMLRLAADLELDVVAEGVETSRQAEILQGHGCRLAQGYLFSPPRELSELRRLRSGGAPRPRDPAEAAAEERS
jgi:diguanylate cyclase (GGDEF)-like protein/PAS domain S-box-containing protein